MMDAFQRIFLMAGGAQIFAMNDNISHGHLGGSLLHGAIVLLCLYLSRPRKGAGRG